mgnify:CR=1 FL=1
MILRHPSAAAGCRSRTDGPNQRDTIATAMVMRPSSSTWAERISQASNVTVMAPVLVSVTEINRSGCWLMSFWPIAPPMDVPTKRNFFALAAAASAQASSVRPWGILVGFIWPACACSVPRQISGQNTEFVQKCRNHVSIPHPWVIPRGVFYYQRFVDVTWQTVSDRMVFVLQKRCVLS